MSLKDGAETAVRDIRRRTRKQFSAAEKIRIVLSGLRGKDFQLYYLLQGLPSQSERIAP